MSEYGEFRERQDQVQQNIARYYFGINLRNNLIRVLFRRAVDL